MINGIFSTAAFIIGASTSIVCGYLGMTIATFANARTTVSFGFLGILGFGCSKVPRFIKP